MDQTLSVGVNPAPQKVEPQIEPKHEIYILISFFWVNTPKGPIATNDELASSVCEYFKVKWGIVNSSTSILKFDRDMSAWSGRNGRPRDEDLLGYFIARKTPNSDVFKRWTTIEIPPGLTKKTRKHMKQLVENMEEDGRMKKVRAAWNKHGENQGPLQPKSFDSPTFPQLEIERVALGADLDLNSNDP